MRAHSRPAEIEFERIGVWGRCFCLLGLLTAVVALGPPGLAQAATPSELVARIAELDRNCAAHASTDPAIEVVPSSRELRERIAALASSGTAAAEAALLDFEAAPTLARRARAWIVLQAGGTSAIEAAVRAARDPDVSVRADLARFLARSDLGRAQIDARVRALASLARDDDQAQLRAQATAALSELDQPESLSALEALVPELVEPERSSAALELFARARARTALLERLARSWPADRSVFDDALVARLLPGYARALVDRPEFAAQARARAVLLAASRSSDPRLRAAAGEALRALVGRAELYGESPRAETLLDALELDGWDARGVAFERARLVQRLSGSPSGLPSDLIASARARAVALERLESGSDSAARLSRARSSLVRAALEIAAGDDVAARAALELARELARSVLAERADLGLALQGRVHVAALEVDALARLDALCLALAPFVSASGDASGGLDVRAPELTSAARELHLAALALQRAGWRTGADSLTSLDGLLEAELSPFELALHNARFPLWPARRVLGLREAVGRVLARVAPRELPGLTDRGDAAPTADEAPTLELLKQAQLARLDLLQKELGELSGRLLRSALEDPCGAEPRLAERAAMIYFERDDAAGSLRDDGAQAREALLDLRTPSTLALDLARDWRDEGRPEKARALLTALREDLELSGVARRFVWGLQLESEIEIALGSTWSDANEPERAQAELERAVERLQGLEELVVERHFGAGALQRVRNQRASALVSLAVNANVKGHDPQRAWGYFERAWALRQDEFMRVLRACYLARVGRCDEARALLREVAPSPLNHYNMACTWALCGEKELALDFLRRELEENHVSQGAADKQRAWARSDPDLANLRGDARFEALVK